MTPAPLTIATEWLEAPEVKAPELAATWARIEISIAGECVTLLEDRRAQAVHRGLYAPAYPLAEWIAYNWWLIQFDTRDQKKDEPGRHSLLRANDGIPWPDLRISPKGDHTELVWTPYRHSDSSSISYMKPGRAYLPSNDLYVGLAGFVDSVLERLETADIQDTPLSEEWEAINSLDGEERSFAKAASRLGIDPFNPPESLAGHLTAAEQVLGDESTLAEFLDAVDPASIEAGAAWITESTSAFKSMPSGVPGNAIFDIELDSDSTSLPDYFKPPWKVGYNLAREVRKKLEPDLSERIKIEDLVPKEVVEGKNHGVVAIGDKSRETLPRIVFGMKQSEGTERFAQARSLWHALAQRERDRFLITNASTEEQQMARSFAAELLAPAEGIKEILHGIYGIGETEIEQAANHFGVSSRVVGHQIENQLAGPSYI